MNGQTDRLYKEKKKKKKKEERKRVRKVKEKGQGFTMLVSLAAADLP